MNQACHVVSNVLLSGFLCFAMLKPEVDHTCLIRRSALPIVVEPLLLSGDTNRLTDIADFLLSNRFHTLKHLRGAHDPESWPGASMLSDGELELVQKLIRQKSVKSRYAYS